jgi:hypothetical protein
VFQIPKFRGGQLIVNGDKLRCVRRWVERGGEERRGEERVLPA